MKQNKKPIVELEWSYLDYALEAIAFTAAVSAPLIAFSHYSELPNTIPIHFNSWGEPDGRGGKAFLWLLPVLGLGTYALMTFLNKSPHTFNYPVQITEDNAEWQYTRATRAIRLLKAVICFCFALITWFMIKTAMGEAQGLPTWLLFLLLGGTLIPVFILLFGRTKKR